MQSSELVKKYLDPLVSVSRVAILGFGREGQSTYRFLRHFFPNLTIAILDQARDLGEVGTQIANDAHVKLFLGREYLSGLSQCDFVFKSPGVSPYRLEIQDSLIRGTKFTSETEIFFSLFGHQTIAVTGTKGKSTACQVITHVLQEAGKEVVFIGNIGAPAFDALEKIKPESLIVYETSSHQSEGISASPHMAIFLNLYQDHLDYYPSMQEYGQAKRQLFVNQQAQDYHIVNLDDARVVSLTRDIKSKKVGFSTEARVNTEICVTESWIVAFGKRLMPIQEIPLLGGHNLLNCFPAIVVAHLLGIGDEQIRHSLKTVTPVKGRLETVGTVKNVKFIDDALATIPEATIEALNALGGHVQTLIVGGYDRGQDFTTLARKIADSKVKNLILFPTTGEKISALVSQYTDRIAFYPVETMIQAVKTALLHTEGGESVLLSTASASFGLFRDYRDRSEQYSKAIEQVKGN